MEEKRGAKRERWCACCGETRQKKVNLKKMKREVAKRKKKVCVGIGEGQEGVHLVGGGWRRGRSRVVSRGEAPPQACPEGTAM